MEYPFIAVKVLEKLDRFGFEGIDASMTTSLFEYGGLWSEKHGIAILCAPDGKDPGVCFQRISAKDIADEVKQAGEGFAGFVDANNCGLPDGMSAIQGLMLWCGGWHLNSSQWRPLSRWRTDELIRVIETMCKEAK